MTEAEWFACTHPKSMLKFLHGKENDRKLRLFLIGCWRRIWHLLADERARAAVEVAERFADGLASEPERETASQAALAAMSDAHAAVRAIASVHEDGEEMEWPFSSEDHIASATSCVATAIRSPERLCWGHCGPFYHPERAAQNAAWASTGWTRYGDATARAREAAEELLQCCLLRCVFGPTLFRTVPFSRSPLTRHDRLIVGLAKAAYSERVLPAGTLGPPRLAVLADALDEAGGTHAELLAHLREPGPHVRGCWPLDLILGKD